MLAAALVWIQIQDLRIRSWRQTSGRIVSSQAAARTIRRERHSTPGRAGDTDFVTDETIETRNFAEVSYAFAIDGKTYNGSRIGLGADGGNVEVAETLRRYPAGAIVTVVYDPADPTQCILERDDPKNLRRGWFAVATLAALIVGGVLGIGRLADAARSVIDDPKRVPLVIVLGLFAAVVALFAAMVGRKRRDMRSWTGTPGRIVESTVATTTRLHRRPASLQRETIYVPRVVYQYETGGLALRGDDIGATWRNSTPAAATTCVARYPVDAAVTVLVNPANPTESTLMLPGRSTELVLWAIAGLLVAATVALATLIPVAAFH